VANGHSNCIVMIRNMTQATAAPVHTSDYGGQQTFYQASSILGHGVMEVDRAAHMASPMQKIVFCVSRLRFLKFDDRKK
jgi:hypothetical protein